MSDLDELDINPLFKALQESFLQLYEEAQENCHLICIPCSDCLQGIHITRPFVQTHILKASPFFKGEYMTLKSPEQIVTIEEGADYITTQAGHGKHGFPSKENIKILNEELGYNKDYKPYKMLIIEKPLDSSYTKDLRAQDMTASDEFKPKYSLKECRQFLESYPEFNRVTGELNENLSTFNKNYMLLKDYLSEASARLQQISSSATEGCLKCSRHKHWMNSKYRDMLIATIETYIMASVHQKVFSVVCSKFTADDTTMVDLYKKLTGLTANQLGVPHYFAGPLPSAVVELAHLDSLTTPIEKLYCLKTTFDNITKDINSNVQELQGDDINTEDVPCLTSDDLIPILVTVIVHAKCSHIHGNIYYMENFYWSAGAKDSNLSYCLVTFKAAVQYMTSNNFDQMDLQRNLSQNEISIDDLMSAKWDKSISTTSDEPSTSSMEPARPRNSSQSRIDRQMTSITKMLEESSKELTPSGSSVKKPLAYSVFGESVPQHQPTPDLVPDQDPRKKKEQMGDFLSSLQDDMFLSFGKQT